ncbi:sigma-70 family RNA polymerase sigma factor [candidate division KSB1 bacterium]|nr:sigma-70 family RNA polymerase sigma factor [candidate division KSB1 bacterium]
MDTNKDFDEGRLIRRCQQGDSHAYGVMVEHYKERAYYSALGLVSSHEAALDLSQEAFVRAYRSISKLEPERKFFTWFYQILRHLCFNHLRDRARHARPFSEINVEEVQQIVDTSQNTEEHIEQAEMKTAVWRAIDSLKENDKEIIILKDFQNMSYKEIAEVLECPIGTVMSRLYTARQALKSKLEGYFDE